ncbi:MAG: acetyl-CoA carboxylase biotin carboxylase subunit [Candidatus Omnitrophica bacterium]|nr:acetyl-CoA carboxylase biotin carboxylase subunit [Candidatus Omnitrophota bacterium]MCA9425998.1 acetyl-CoA carboxylase biotin carboxylase subunit [Candidatus Omnitrophota bacterium]MCA9443858.1 acetyl-CoA carboxylase biotin carboxylase subunit [Candidatus Omnitrophota bacterium]MCB9767431.1 acetyl-CoA carboxylase biotin carboxylase subunit [Candidatus Omnitrophota bacterium]
MFKKILVANRGEIALRVIRASRELGIPTVAVYSEADRDSLHVRFADEHICIGAPSAKESYLSVPRLIAAAEITDADAVHPGYGFLAEDASFAEVCESCNLTFIGPDPKVISQMGDKLTARAIAKDAGVPILPSSDGAVANESDALEIAEEIGYPVILKASGGGGGRGMRIARNSSELTKAYTTAKAEAAAAFNNSEIYLEKLVEKGRHVEVQVLGDQFGNVIHLGERDCSSQRRYQKVVEESPAPNLPQEVRERIWEAGVRCAKAVDYQSAGTIEFLLAPDGGFYFLEMNTRIQVEHPVTEMVTGINIVAEQIRVAAGNPLRYKQDDVNFRGHAIECRINAEDPENGFMPCAGHLDVFNIAGGFGVRVDTHCYSDYHIPPYYDSLIGKLIVHAENREEAILRMKRALDEFVIEGVKTTIPFCQTIMNYPDFREGNVHTKYLEEMLAESRLVGA